MCPACAGARDGLDVGAVHMMVGLKPCSPEKPHRLQRARTTAGVQGSGVIRHPPASPMPRSVSPHGVHAGSRTTRPPSARLPRTTPGEVPRGPCPSAAGRQGRREGAIAVAISTAGASSTATMCPRGSTARWRRRRGSPSAPKVTRQPGESSLKAAAWTSRERAAWPHRTPQAQATTRGRRVPPEARARGQHRDGASSEQRQAPGGRPSAARRRPPARLCRQRFSCPACYPTV